VIDTIHALNLDQIDWDNVGPAMYGFSDDPAKGSGALTPGMTMFTRSTPHAPLYSPENPLFWLGGLLLLASGAIYLSTSFKVGPAKGSLNL
jgi:hypothetical protein